MGKTMKIVTGILSVVIIMPIWYFLLYTILIAIQPDRLVWFLFWIYVPLGIIVNILIKFIEGD